MNLHIHKIRLHHVKNEGIAYSNRALYPYPWQQDTVPFPISRSQDKRVYTKPLVELSPTPSTQTLYINYQNIKEDIKERKGKKNQLL